VGPRIGLDAVAKIKHPCPCRGSKLGRPVRSLVTTLTELPWFQRKRNRIARWKMVFILCSDRIKPWSDWPIGGFKFRSTAKVVEQCQLINNQNTLTTLGLTWNYLKLWPRLFLYYLFNGYTDMTRLPEPRLWKETVKGRKVKMSLCWTKRHAVKTYWGSGGIALHILHFGTKWRWVASFTFRPVQPRRKNCRYQLERRLARLHGWSGRGGEEKRFHPLKGLKPQSSSP
jgi:hypothetical protein